MDIATIFVIILIVLISNALMVLIVLSKTKTPKENTANFDLVLRQMNEFGKMVDTRLSENIRQMNDNTRHMTDSIFKTGDASLRTIREINEQMTKNLSDVSRGVAEVTESSKQVFSLADQLQNLEKVLKHQKQRGNLGEAGLELTLSTILPTTGYKSQYQFKDGKVVDAVIITKEGMIPVDAKFSLDNYNRVVMEENPEHRDELEKEFKNDLKKRIDETAKYIRPEEGTLPFAFMFIPAEGIYYDLLVNEVGAVKVNTRNLIDYAYRDKNVIIVSPTTFAAYLQSVLYGFKAFRIEESAKFIRKNVEELGRHLNAYAEYHQKLGNSLGTVINHYNASGKEFKKIDKDVLRITGEATDIEVIAISGPEKDFE